MLVAAFLLQAVAGPPAPRESRPAAAPAPAPCPVEDASGDVVVCARKSDPPRLAKLPEETARSPQDMMTFRLPGHATGNLHAIQSQLPGGSGAGGAVTLRIPFGKGKKE